MKTTPYSLATRSMIAIVVAAGFLTAIPAAPAVASEPTTLVVEIPGRGPFIDDDGSVFEFDIATLAAAGVVSGCDVGRYCPDEPVTRGEMAALLHRARPQIPVPGGPSPFVDTAGSVFEDDIAALAAARITSGCGADRYCPDQPVTRGEMAAFLHRTFAGTLTLSTDLTTFADTAGHLFAQDISWLSQTGVTSGCGDGSRFCPDQPVTRAQMAAFLRRALDLPTVALTDTVEIDASKPIGPGVDGWRPLVEHFFQPEDVERALAVMECESHGNPNAANSHSTAAGLFQHLASRFPARAKAAGYEGASVFDPVANVAVAAYLVYTDGWWHWNASRGCWS